MKCNTGTQATTYITSHYTFTYESSLTDTSILMSL